MKQVTKDYFYEKIGPLDVCVSSQGAFPSTSLFKTRGGILKGKVVEKYTDDVKHRYPMVLKLITQTYKLFICHKKKLNTVAEFLKPHINQWLENRANYKLNKVQSLFIRANN